MIAIVVLKTQGNKTRKKYAKMLTFIIEQCD